MPLSKLQVQPETDITVRSHNQFISCPAYQCREKREGTFGAWNSTVPAHKMIEAGLFVIGPGDRVKCFACGVVLRDWTEGDVPLLVHKNASPNCRLVQMKQTKDYGQHESHLTEQESGSSPDSSLEPEESEMNATSGNREVVIDALTFMYGDVPQRIERAMEVFRERHGEIVFTARDIAEIMEEMNEESTAGGLLPEDGEVDEVARMS